MSSVFRWAVEADFVTVNPVAGVSKISTDSDGFHTWTVEQVEQYRFHHKLGTRQRLAIDILLFLGLRRADAVVVGRQHCKDGLISLKTGKTGQWVYLPVFKQLRESIEATETGDLAYLATTKGKPFTTGASFGNWFAKQCKAAGCRTNAERMA
jgi:integrase